MNGILLLLLFIITNASKEVLHFVHHDHATKECKASDGKLHIHDETYEIEDCVVCSLPQVITDYLPVILLNKQLEENFSPLVTRLYTPLLIAFKPFSPLRGPPLA